METKRGRPKGPEKVGLFFRVEKKDEEAVRRLVGELLGRKELVPLSLEEARFVNPPEETQELRRLRLENETLRKKIEAIENYG